MQAGFIKKLGIFILAGTMVLMAGCSKKSTSDELNTETVVMETDSDTSASKKDSQAAKQDVNIESSNENQSETELEISDNIAERVVASSVAVTEILDALDITVVGAPTSSYELPERAESATKIGNPMSPDMEVIASLDPTIVIGVTSLEPTYGEEFKKLNIPAAFVDLNSYDGLLETITYFGELFGVEEKASELLQSYAKAEEAAEAAAKDQESPSVLIIFGASNSFMTATESSYVGDLVKRAGGSNIVTDVEGSFIPVDFEYLAEKNPDYILFMAHANPEESMKAFEEEFSSNAAWDNFDAVANGNVIALETGTFGMSANLLAGDALNQLTGIFYK